MSNLGYGNNHFNVVGSKMIRLGWVSKIDGNYQDSWYEWTEMGISLFGKICSEMKRQEGKFTIDEIRFVNDNLYSLGIIKKCKRELSFINLQEVFSKWGGEGLTATNGINQSRFERPQIFELHDWIYTNNGSEIVISDSNGMMVMKIPANAYP